MDWERGNREREGHIIIIINLIVIITILIILIPILIITISIELGEVVGLLGRK